MKIFHIYADGKTVKEISWEEYRAFSEKQRRVRKFLRVWANEVTVCHHNNYIWIRREQLEQVLKECWTKPK